MTYGNVGHAAIDTHCSAGLQAGYHRVIGDMFYCRHGNFDLFNYQKVAVLIQMKGTTFRAQRLAEISSRYVHGGYA
jgi:hypothetical protein